MPMEPDDEQMLVVSVPDKIHCEGALVYHDFKDQVTDRSGGDFFILPSNIHGVNFVSDNGNIHIVDIRRILWVSISSTNG